MQDKQKVTLYLPPALHRQLKVKAALDDQSMSGLVEQAILFYLNHPEVVEDVEGSTTYGKTHQVFFCPECASGLVVREGEMVSLKNQPSVLMDGLEGESVPASGEPLVIC